MVITTLSDFNYLPLGLTLVDSLPGETIYYLCLDKETYDYLKHDKRVIPVYVEDSPLRYREEEIAPLVMTSATPYAYWCWSLASRFTREILELEKEVAYVDADIKFYHPLAQLGKEIADCDIGMTPHLHNRKGCNVGAYNVGVVYFKNTPNAIDCLDFWIDCLMRKENTYRKEYGRCGDQKYLELFEDMFSKVHIIGDTLTQGAPWNFSLFNWNDFSSDNQKVIYGGKEQPLQWVHFSGFKLKKNGYDSNTQGFGNFFVNQKITDLYNDYHTRVRDNDILIQSSKN